MPAAAVTGVTLHGSGRAPTGRQFRGLPQPDSEMKHRWMIAVALATFALAPWAQTVYESKDKAGPVFSDKPSPGAQPVQLQPPNVINTPAVAPPAPPLPGASAPAYRRLVITRPANQDSVHSNDGAMGIAAQLSPPLRPNDRIRVLVDGNLVPTVYRTTNPRITPADWQATAFGGRGEHTLQLAVVDADGVPLIQSPVVNIYVHRAAVGGTRR